MNNKNTLILPYVLTSICSILISLLLVKDAMLFLLFIFVVIAIPLYLKNSDLINITLMINTGVILAFINSFYVIGTKGLYLILAVPLLHYLISFLYKPLSENTVFTRSKHEYLLGVIFLILVVSTILFSEERAYGFSKLKGTSISLLVSFYVSSILLKKKKPELLISSFIIIGSILILCSMILTFHLTTHYKIIPSVVIDRLSILGINPIWVARALGYSIISCSYFIIKWSKNLGHKLLETMLLVVYVLISFYFLMLTASRGPILGVLAGLTIIFLLKSKINLSSIFGVILIIVLIFGMLTFSPENVRGRVLDSHGTGGSSITIRFMLHYQAWNFFMSHKLFGIGFGSFSQVGFHYPHNIFSEFLCETGLIGILAFLCYLFYLIWQLLCYRHLILKNDIYIVICGVLLAGFINANLSGHVGSNIEFWMPSIILLSMIEVEKRSIQ